MVSTVDDRTVCALVLLFGIALVVWFLFCAALLAITRALSATARAAGHAAHEAWEWAAAWVLVAVTWAGPLDADPDSYAARSAALPMHTDRTPGGHR